jgi:DNA/RNA-binding domain of Phe-tRNA-synthetase-like protein
MLIVSDEWLTTYPGGAVGVLLMENAANPDYHPYLDQRKTELEGELRSRYAGWDRAALKTLPIIQAYNAYYKRFKKSYHVLLQLESVALKGKPIPSVAALVEAMFMAELKNLLLTAGHDFTAVQEPLTLEVAQGDEVYERINGQEQTPKAGDMQIADAQAIISNVIYGPDRRTRIRPDTHQVLFTVYAPPGIGRDSVAEHLEDLQSNVRVVAPEADVTHKEVYLAP